MHHVAITATTTHRSGERTYLDTFTFEDGATVHVSGGLICSQHGRFHCRHHRVAHEAIITKAAAQVVPQDVEAPQDPSLPLVDAAAVAEPNRKYAYLNDWLACQRMKTILAATTVQTPAGLIFRQFAFWDGIVVTNQDRLICSQQGRHQCYHQEMAAEVIALAARRAAGEDVWSRKADIHFMGALTLEDMAEAAVEAADDFNANYDNWEDRLPGVPMLAAYGGVQ